MPRIYLSNDTADVSGYLIAYVDERSPNASTTVSTSVTTATNSGDNIAGTLTAGGSAAKWITKPFLAAATLVTKVNASIWGLEDSAATNTLPTVRLYPYSSDTEGSIFLDGDSGAEWTTSAAANRFTTIAATSQAFVAGDRLVIKLYVGANGTMAAGTVTVDYNGSVAGADGDTFIDILEDFRVNETQTASGATPLKTIGSASQFTAVIDAVQWGLDAGYFGNGATSRSIRDIMTFERNLLSPRTAQSTPV